MVINDHDEKSSAFLSFFIGIWQIAGIRLPHAAKEFFFKGFAILHVQVPGGFQVVALNETLNRSNRYSGRDKSLLDKPVINLSGIEPWKFFLESVDFFDGRIRQGSGKPFILANSGKKSIHAPIPVT